MDELISVIIPVYNVEEYLEICVGSVVKQTYDKLEILIIDDGSADSSGKLCDELELTDARIKTYHKENGGLSDARNYGMERAHGNFYAFIDSDDVLHEDFFLELMKAQHNYDADIVACEMTLFHDKDELFQLFAMHHSVRAKKFSREEALNEYFSPIGDRCIHHGLCMKVYKKELFHNLRFEKGKLHEDLYITYKLLDSSDKVVYVDCPYYFYYQNNAGSICKNYGVKNFLDESEAYRQIYSYFEERNRVSEELIRFMIIQYLLMLEKGYRIRRLPEIQEESRHIKWWVGCNLKKCSYFGMVKRILIHLTLSEIRIYMFLKKIWGKD